jgi:hypothetical protein
VVFAANDANKTTVNVDRLIYSISVLLCPQTQENDDATETRHLRTLTLRPTGHRLRRLQVKTDDGSADKETTNSRQRHQVRFPSSPFHSFKVPEPRRGSREEAARSRRDAMVALVLSGGCRPSHNDETARAEKTTTRTGSADMNKRTDRRRRRRRLKT